MFYTIEELSEKFKVSEGTIRKLIHAGHIKAIKIGKQYRVHLAEVTQIEEQGLLVGVEK